MSKAINCSLRCCHKQHQTVSSGLYQRHHLCSHRQPALSSLLAKFIISSLSNHQQHEKKNGKLERKKDHQGKTLQETGSISCKRHALTVPHPWTKHVRDTGGHNSHPLPDMQRCVPTKPERGGEKEKKRTRATGTSQPRHETRDTSARELCAVKRGCGEDASRVTPLLRGFHLDKASWRGDEMN